MVRARRGVEQQESLPFEIPESPLAEPPVSPIRERIWTENKAKLIERYLYYFVLITKHGTYIDGFAGPQYKDKVNSWAAKLVLESEPRRLRHFHLYDTKKNQFRQLETLRDSQPPPNKERKEPKRTIDVTRGDFNILVADLLESASIRQKEATFCLLDQRTFECHWSTVRALAEYKTSGHKIELFYFLPNSWLDRSLAALRNTSTLKNWWGREDWQELRQMGSDLPPCITSGLKLGSVSRREETDDEAEPVYGRTDHRDAARASGRDVCGRSVPQARDLGGDILQVAREVWRAGGVRRPQAEGA